MDIRFDEEDLSGGKYLGAGIFACQIITVNHTNSKKGDPMLEVEFGADNGKTTKDWFMLSGKKFKLASLALALGHSKEDLLAGRFKTEGLMGKKVKVVREKTGEEEYKGKMVARYENSYLPLDGAKAPASTDEEVPF